MSNLFRRLWADDQGAVISTELVLVIGILIFGIIPGLVALRNSIIGALGTIGNTLSALVPSFTYSGFVIGTAGGTLGGNIAQVQGYQLNPSQTNILTGDQTAPINLGTTFVIPPSP
jgi:ABC-type lipoprotein release transport system permease subunit